MRKCLMALALGAAIASAAGAQAPTATSISAAYAEAVAAPGRPARMVTLDASRKPAETLAFFGLARGDVAVDLYAGGGDYTELMARGVGPEGRVTGTMSAPSYSGEARTALDALVGRNPNVSINAGSPDRFDYPPESPDFVMMSLAYHDLYFVSAEYGYPMQNPRHFLAQVFAALRPGGIVGVVDHVAEPGGDTRAVVDALHRIDPAVVRADFEAAGFVFDGASEILRDSRDDHSLLVFDESIRGRTDRFVFRFSKPE